MLDIELIKKLSKEFTSKIDNPDFIEFLLKHDIGDLVDNFFGSISEVLIEYKEKKDIKNG